LLEGNRSPCRDRQHVSILSLFDGWIIADEAARLADDLIAALRPMRARRPEARFAMLSGVGRTASAFGGVG